jgi:hypothetical protein
MTQPNQLYFGDNKAPRYVKKVAEQLDLEAGGVG